MVINVTALVYAIPIVAIAVVVLRLVVGAATARRTPGVVGFRRRRRSFVPGLVMGIGGMLVASVMFVRADADMRRFASDPTCSAGLAANATPGGSCRVVGGYIDDFYWTSGRGAHRRLVVRLADGSQQTVDYGTDRRGSVWYGAMRRGDRNATVQLFDGSVVALQTLSGTTTTGMMPVDRFGLWAFAGIFAGIVGIFSALGLAFRGTGTLAGA